jgi:excisionase family DNA binding protein
MYRGQMSEEPQWFTTAQVAQRLGVSQSTVQRWASLDLIRYNRLPSGRLRISRAEVERLLKERGPELPP